MPEFTESDFSRWLIIAWDCTRDVETQIRIKFEGDPEKAQRACNAYVRWLERGCKS